MSKKSFKDNAANINRFFSENDTQTADSTPNTLDTSRTYSTQNTADTSCTYDTQAKPYRINLKLRPQFKNYLDDAAWKARKSITEYLNDLIQADIDSKK